MSFWSRIERGIESIAGDLIPDEFRERLSGARTNLESGQLEEAESELQDLVRLRPDHAAAQTLLGVTLLSQEKIDAARDAFDRALALDAELPEALIGRGNTALVVDTPELAIPYFRDAIDAAGGDQELLSEVYHALGRAYRASGDLGKAIRELRKAAAESGGNSAIIADLGDALSIDGSRSHTEARRYLKRLADRDGCPPVAWIALGRISLGNEDPEGAISYFERVLQSNPDNTDDSTSSRDGQLSFQANMGIANAYLELENGEKAKFALQIALRQAAPNFSVGEIYSKLGQAHNLLGDNDAAMTSFRRALSGQPMAASHHDTAKRALRLTLAHGDIPGGVEMANHVLASDASDADALTARGLELAANSQIEAARATYEHALENGANYETFLARAALELSVENYDLTQHFLSLALREKPDSTRGKTLLSACQSSQLGVKMLPESSWYDLASALSRLCGQEPALLPLRQLANQALSEYDQPLLVAVMGEFSSGKSSFVNAFVGTDVAPTGITPTTATINIVKYGRSKAGRVIYRDNTSRDIAGNKLFAALGAINDDEARRIQHVEILMPIDILERVNIIDTPGLNSILPEHEAVARSFLKRADAVIWVFTVNQAGKSTEKLALDSIRETGVRVLGVLNKVDQLSKDQVGEVLAYVDSELGDRVEACIPISARKAIAGDADSGWDAMRDELESRFFNQARTIKKQALNRRLHTLLDSAHDAVASSNHQSIAFRAALRTAAKQARECMFRFVDEVVEQERLRIAQDTGLLYRNAAQEVLELVRPRKLPFGSNKATQADRDYLLGLLDSGFDSLLQESKSRCIGVLTQYVEEIISPERNKLEPLWDALDSRIKEGLKLAQAEVWTQSLAFVRGYLRGGFVDHFFQVELGKIELTEDAIYHVLFRSSPELDTQLSLPLAKAGGQLLEDLSDFLDGRADNAEVQFLVGDSGLSRALSSLSEHRQELATRLDGNDDSK